MTSPAATAPTPRHDCSMVRYCSARLVDPAPAHYGDCRRRRGRSPPSAREWSRSIKEWTEPMKTKRVAGSGSTGASNGTEAGLIVLRQEPFNAETPLAEQIGLLTSNPSFDVRSHFPFPRLDVAT